MSKRTIILIVLLIAASLIGVIGLQLNLIRTGMEVNEQRYDEAVRDALRAVAKELEETEESLIEYATSSGYNKRGEPTLGATLDFNLATPDLLTGQTGLSLKPTASTSIERARYTARDLEDRVDRRFFKKLIEAEFADAELSGLRYGILDTRQGQIVYRDGRRLSQLGRDTARHVDLMSSTYRVPLYDTDLTTPAYLLAYKPNKGSYIFRTILNNLLASLLFISIILGCFIYTIYVILFQKKLSEMKTDFINNMTHEFKTPIATISLATDSIASKRVIADPSKVMRFIGIIKQENKRMNDQVEKVLQMAKLDKNKLNLNLTAVDLNEVVEDAAIYIGLQVEQRDGRVETHLDADPGVIEGDLTHISSLVNNLLDNANKYSPEAPHIIIRTRNVKNGVELTVQDHGLGMSREARKNIFDRFYRVHTGDRHDVKGFGLGLSYVKTITEVHGGSIDVRSELGKGSSFIVTFPYRQPQT